MATTTKYWCCVCTSFTGRPESIEAGSESESNEADLDVCPDSWPLRDDEDAEFDEASALSIIGRESELSIFFTFRLFSDFRTFSSLASTDSRASEFDLSTARCKFCKGDGAFRLSPLEEEERTEVSAPGLCPSSGVKISSWSWSESMSSKSLIKLSANNSRDVEQTLGESENRRGDPIVQCSSSARSSSVSGKSNGVGVFLPSM